MNINDITNNVIELAHRALTIVIDMSDFESDDESEFVAELERRRGALIDDYCHGRADALLFLRAVNKGAIARSAEFKAEAERWARLAAHQARIAAFATASAERILVEECRLAGFGDEDPYGVKFPNGSHVRLAVSKAVEITGELPEEYKRTKTIVEPDKVAIGKVLKEGGEVEGASLRTNRSVNWGR